MFFKKGDFYMKKKVGNLFLFLGLLLILTGCIFLVKKFREYQEIDKTYGELRDKAVSGDDDGHFTVDWEALKGTDVVAWIRYGKSINYPVLQGKDNAFYLHHLYNRKYNYGGSVFLHSDCRPDFFGRNSILYGHNMRNGSMFGTLKKKTEKDSKFYIYLPDGTRHTYQVTAIANVMDGTRAYTYQFPDMDSFVSYQEYMSSRSKWDFGVKPESEPDTKLVSLST